MSEFLVGQHNNTIKGSDGKKSQIFEGLWKFFYEGIKILRICLYGVYFLEWPYIHPGLKDIEHHENSYQKIKVKGTEKYLESSNQFTKGTY